jgi:hypothetical protein
LTGDERGIDRQPELKNNGHAHREYMYHPRIVVPQALVYSERSDSYP